MITTKILTYEDCHTLRMTSDRLQWDIILLEEDELFYKALLKHLKNGTRYGASEGADSETSISTKESQLKFQSYAVVCGRDMNVTFTLDKDDGINVLELVIAQLGELFKPTN